MNNNIFVIFYCFLIILMVTKVKSQNIKNCDDPQVFNKNSDSTNTEELGLVKKTQESDIWIALHGYDRYILTHYDKVKNITPLINFIESKNPKTYLSTFKNRDVPVFPMFDFDSGSIFNWINTCGKDRKCHKHAYPEEYRNPNKIYYSTENNFCNLCKNY